MEKKYKPHMMYCKDGSEKKAMTYKEHLTLKKKGCGHKKLKDTDKVMKSDPNSIGRKSGGKKATSSNKFLAGAGPKGSKKPKSAPKRGRGTRDKDGNIIGGIKP